MSELSTADRRNLASVERLAHEVLEQCGFMRANTEAGHDDMVRWLMIEILAYRLHLKAQIGERRYRRDYQRRLALMEKELGVKS